MIKKIALLFIAAACFITANAQKDDDAERLKKIQRLPAFQIHTVPDSIIFHSEALKKNEPVILMFFSPDCDHCQKETKELLAYKEELKNLQIIMVSHMPYNTIKTFYTDYSISSMPNVKMGHDKDFVLSLQYRPKTYPGIYIYNAKGELAKAFVGNVGVPAILDAIKE